MNRRPTFPKILRGTALMVLCLWLLPFLAMGQHGYYDHKLLQDVRANDLQKAQADFPAYADWINVRGTGGDDWALVLAMRANNLAICAELVHHGALLSVVVNCGYPKGDFGNAATRNWFEKQQSAALAMSQAAKRGDLKTIQSYVGRGYSIDLADKDNKRPLFYAAEAGNKALVQDLLNLGAKAELPGGDAYYTVPLRVAAQKGYAEIVSLLLNKGAKPDGPSGNYQASESGTALHDAILNNQTEVALRLIARGANVNADYSTGNTPFDIACYRHNRVVLDALLAKGIKIRDNARYRAFALRSICNWGDVDMFKTLVDRLHIDPYIHLAEPMHSLV